VKRAAFLDRDGVINREPPEGHYVTRWEEMQFLPGVAEAISLLGGAGFRVIIVTNQSCVAKGLLTVPELDLIHQRMCGELAAAGAVIDDVYYCPHEEQPPCSCRKPAPGMLLTVARAHQIDLTASWMIGDSDRDMEAGRRAGCRTARILKSEQVASSVADVSAQSLLHVVEKILLLEGDVVAE
jgi:D-glycero-D-manno-heptose 1,7-bisphosphate phosphatase